MDLTAFLAQVARYETLEGSVEALIAGFAKQQSDAVAAAIAKTLADDAAKAAEVQAAAQAAIDGVTTQFTGDNDKLAAAVAANTPAAPTA